MPKTDKMKDFWVVLKGIPAEKGLCRGFDDQKEAENDAKARTQKAKAEFGKDWQYEAIPNPKK